jgi:hypothetical protein
MECALHRESFIVANLPEIFSLQLMDVPFPGDFPVACRPTIVSFNSRMEVTQRFIWNLPCVFFTWTLPCDFQQELTIPMSFLITFGWILFQIQIPIIDYSCCLEYNLRFQYFVVLMFSIINHNELAGSRHSMASIWIQLLTFLKSI